MTRGFWMVIACLGMCAAVAFNQWAGFLGWILVGYLANMLPPAQ